MSDTPVPFPPSRLEAVKGLIGDLARPFAIISTSLSASVAIVVIAFRVDKPDFSSAAIFIGAVGAFVGGIYTAKAWEVFKTSQQAAEVEKAKAATPST